MDLHSGKFFLNETVIMLTLNGIWYTSQKPSLDPTILDQICPISVSFLGRKVLEMVVGLEFQDSTPEHWIQIAFTHNCGWSSCPSLSLSSFQYLQSWYPPGPANEFGSG